MGDFFEGAKRFNLLDNSLALLALHLAAAGLVSSHWATIAPGVTTSLPLGCFLFGAVFAVIAVYYGVVNAVSLRKLVELNEEWENGPPARPLLADELKTLAFVAAVVPIVVLCALAATGLPIWPGGLAPAILAAMVISPLPLAWNRFSPLVAIMRGTLALLSMLSFVLAVSLPLLPRAVATASQGFATEVREAAQTGTPPPIPQGNTHPGRDGRDGREGGRGTDGRAGEAGRNAVVPAGPSNVELERRLTEMERNLGIRIDALGNRSNPPPEFIPVQGPQGLPGRDGRDGRPGQEGRQGDRGTDGERGQDGRNGADGAAGAEGDMWRCRFALSNPPSFRVCEAVRPDGSVRAPARGEAEQDQS